MGIAQVEEVVVGAGVGGMTAALLLARAGAPVSLLERAATPGDVGAWILLQPNGLAVPTGLGLVGELERAGQRMTVSAVRGSGHAPIATLATPDFGHRARSCLRGTAEPVSRGPVTGRRG
jgi:salicylate hydroxylase